MRAFGIRPKRDLGQNFLIDSNLLGVIARAAALDPADVVLEIGGGLGVLSEHLAARVAHVHVVELDRTLEPALRDALDPHPNATLHFADAMSSTSRRSTRRRRRSSPTCPYGIAAAAILRTVEELPQVGALGGDGAEGGRRAARGARRAPPPTACPRVLAQLACDVRVLRSVSRTGLPSGAERRLRAGRAHAPRARARARAARPRAAGLRAPAQGAGRARSRWPRAPSPACASARGRRSRRSGGPPTRAPSSCRRTSCARCTRS